MTTINGTAGSDTLTGTAGADILEDYLGGDDILLGLGGNDALTVNRGFSGEPDDVRIDGGDGDDRISVTVYNGSRVDILGGAGDDLIHIGPNLGSVRITTGSGVDQIDANRWIPGEAAIVITDFVGGPAGDRILWLDFVDHDLQATTGGNPFASGHARLIQSGSHTLFQIRFNGQGDWLDRIIFENTLATGFTAANFGGYDPSGAPTPGQFIQGGSGIDYIDGTRGDDVIMGSTGADRLAGRQGDDVLNGEDGNDFLDGAGGSDTLNGGLGNDELSAGESGADVLSGGDGADILDVSRDHLALNQTIRLSGDAGDDTIYLALLNGSQAIVDGGSGADGIFVQNGRGVVITTGAGADTITYGRYSNLTPGLTVTDFEIGVDVLDWTDHRNAFQGLNGANPFLSGYARLAQDGADAVLLLDRTGGADGFVEAVRFSGLQATSLTGSPLGFQALAFDHTGGAGGDGLYGSFLADRLDGGAGDDLVGGGGGNDVLIGGEGFDIASFADAASGVTVSLASSSAQAVGGGLGSDVLSGFEGLIGSAFADTLTGTDGMNSLTGGAGNDLLVGGHGPDLLYGGAGDDVIRVSGPSAASPQPPIGVIAGDTGADTLDLTNVGVVTINHARLTLGTQRYNISGVETYQTGAGSDLLNLSSLGAALTIASGEGGDAIQSGSGADHILAGGGDDVIDGGLGDDIIDGGLGLDVVAFRGLDIMPTVITTIGGVTTVTGYDGVDTLTNVERLVFGYVLEIEPLALSGQTMLNFMWGGELSGGALDDRLYGQGGEDVLSGGTGADLLYGGGGRDTLNGGEGNDVIHGGAGNDLINGGAGTDTVRVSGAASAYTLLRDGDRFILKGADGSDHLADVEFIGFADGVVWDIARQYAEGGPEVLPPALDKDAGHDGPLVLPGTSAGAIPSVILEDSARPGLAEDPSHGALFGGGRVGGGWEADGVLF